MSSTPAHPKIYHITHVDNLSSIVKTKCIWSDAKRIELSLASKVVGMSKIKQRRLEELEVSCNSGTHVGDYVPFYFCPRSIMLYMLHKGNSTDLDYTEGQQPIIHLQADLHEVMEWANDRGRRWAFSTCNAGTYYANFYNDVDDLTKINWTAVDAMYFQRPTIKEGKQAEFLIYESFPWRLVEGIGVMDEEVKIRIGRMLRRVKHRPAVRVEREWYF